MVTGIERDCRGVFVADRRRCVQDLGQRLIGGEPLAGHEAESRGQAAHGEVLPVGRFGAEDVGQDLEVAVIGRRQCVHGHPARIDLVHGRWVTCDGERVDAGRADLFQPGVGMIGREEAAQEHEHPVRTRRAHEVALRAGTVVAGRDDQELATCTPIRPGQADVGDRALPRVIEQSLQVRRGVDHRRPVGLQVQPGERVAHVRVRRHGQHLRADPPPAHQRRASAPKCASHARRIASSATAGNAQSYSCTPRWKRISSRSAAAASAVG